MNKKLRVTLITVLSFLLLSSNVAYGLTTNQLNNCINQCQYQKDVAHNIAESARQLGCAEDNPIIVEASRLWFSYHEDEIKYLEELEANSELDQFIADNQSNIKAIAGTMYAEARGLDARECSMIAWCILNRYDTQRFGSSLHSVIWAKSQFAHSTRTVSDSGIDLVWLATDVLSRWYREKQGETEVGRTLPQGYCFYYGNGHHNLFRMKNSGFGSYNFGLSNPY